MSAMKDLHAEVMDLLEQSVDDAGLDTCACSGEALYVARAFVKANVDEVIRLSVQSYCSDAHRSTLYDRARAEGLVTPAGPLVMGLAGMNPLEVRRFAVALDRRHFAHEVAVFARDAEVPADLRAVVLDAFPMAIQRGERRTEAVA